jgi:hypothetical protein
MGEVISALARQGLARDTQRRMSERNGVLLLPMRNPAVPVMPGLVNQLRDEAP